MNTVYALVDPRTKEIKYVGLTKHTVAWRVAQHMRSSHKVSKGLEVWRTSLNNDGIYPTSIDLEVIADDLEASDAEAFWIAYLKSIGAKLINVHAGGRPKPKASMHWQTYDPLRQF